MSRPVRWLLGILLAGIVVYLLFTWVFPWVDRTFVTDPVVGVVSAAVSGLVGPPRL